MAKVQDNLKLSSDLSETAVNVVKLYQNVDYQDARGKGLGAIIQTLSEMYQKEYDPYTSYIDNWQQEMEALENNKRIENMQSKLDKVLNDAIFAEERRAEIFLELEDTGTTFDKVKDDFKLVANTDYEYLDMLMDMNGFGEDNMCDSMHPHYQMYFKGMGCDIYQKLRETNGMGDVHGGLLPTSKYYSVNLYEQEKLIQQMDADIAAIAYNDNYHMKTMPNMIYRYIALSDKVQKDGLDNVNKQDVDNMIYLHPEDKDAGCHYYSSDALKFMREYNQPLFDTYFSATSVSNFYNDPKTNKLMVNGYQLQPDGTFKSTQMNATFGSHTFTTEECGKLFMGETITIPNFVTKDGKHTQLSGNLQQQTYKGYDFIGFHPVKSVLQKDMSKDSVRVQDYQKLVDTCKLENRVPTKDEYLSFTNDFGVGGNLYSAADLKAMRDYDTSFFDKHMSGLTVEAIGESVKTNKYIAKGMQLQNDGSFQPIVMNASFGNHRFDVQAVGQMLTGQTVEIRNFQSKTGSVQDIQGKLEKQTFKGHTFYGFQREFSSTERQSQRTQALESKFGEMTTTPQLDAQYE